MTPTPEPPRTLIQALGRSPQHGHVPFVADARIPTEAVFAAGAFTVVVSIFDGWVTVSTEALIAREPLRSNSLNVSSLAELPYDEAFNTELRTHIDGLKSLVGEAFAALARV